MRKNALFLLLGLAASSVFADELSDANKQLESGNYAPALQTYNKLSAAGNPEALFHLGEMYWYGEGVAADEVRAKALFEKAAGGGSKQATEALGVMQRRVEHKAEIAFYTQQYDGADVALAKYHCGHPDIPEVSKTAKEITAVSKSVSDWQSCYNGFVAGLNAALPPGKAIPPAIADLMNGPEYDMAKARMDKAYAAVAADAKATSDQIMAANTTWHGNTAEYVKSANAQAEFDKSIDEQERREFARGILSNPGITGSANLSHK